MAQDDPGASELVEELYSLAAATRRNAWRAQARTVSEEPSGPPAGVSAWWYWQGQVEAAAQIMTALEQRGAGGRRSTDRAGK